MLKLPHENHLITWIQEIRRRLRLKVDHLGLRLELTIEHWAVITEVRLSPPEPIETDVENKQKASLQELKFTDQKEPSV